MSSFPICAVEDLPPGSRRVIKLGGREIGVFNVDGEFFAIRNRCPHQGGPLCRGTTTGLTLGEFVEGAQPAIEWSRDGEILRCPWHAWEFDLRSGEAIFGQGMRVRVYRTEVETTVPPPLEKYRTSVESGTVIVHLS